MKAVVGGGSAPRLSLDLIEHLWIALWRDGSVSWGISVRRRRRVCASTADCADAAALCYTPWGRRLPRKPAVRDRQTAQALEASARSIWCTAAPMTSWPRSRSWAGAYSDPPYLRPFERYRFVRPHCPVDTSQGSALPGVSGSLGPRRGAGRLGPGDAGDRSWCGQRSCGSISPPTGCIGPAVPRAGTSPTASAGPGATRPCRRANASPCWLP